MSEIQVCYDGGKDRTEKRDCAVRALATCLEIPYRAAWDELKKRGRRKGAGTKVGMVKDVLRNMTGIELKNVCRHGSLRKFTERFPEGRYLVWITDHFTTVIDGRIWDACSDSMEKYGRKRVHGAWKITKK